MKNKHFSLNQVGAFAALAIVSMWWAWTTWIYFSKPFGLDWTEILFLSALLPACFVLLPFYLIRARWSYINGTIVLLGFVAGFVKSLIDHTYFFSATAHNLGVIAVYLVILSGIYFSLRSFTELPSIGQSKGMIGIVSILGISILALMLVSDNQMSIENLLLRRTIQSVQAKTGNIENLDKKIEALMNEGDIPSLAAAVVVNDEVVWVHGYGDQPGLNQKYDIGSITKPFIATAVLQLYERGLIDLEDDINKHLSFNIRHPDYPQVPITIGMLLTNRSCLAHNNEMYRSYFMGSALQQWGVRQRGWADPQGLENLSFNEFIDEYLRPGSAFYQQESWAACKPGTEFVYSTPGFDLLGYLVEQVSGQTLSNYMNEHIFAPLQMSNTTTTPMDTPEQIAIPYERWYGVLAKTNVELPLSQRKRIGGGGLYSTATDLANFLMAHMNQGSFKGVRLLQPETASLMHSKASQTSGDFMQIGYGYGWGLFQNQPRQMWDITFQPRGFQGHGGRFWGYGSAMYMVDEEDGAYGYVLLVNSSITESMDEPWFFAINANLQDLLLQEAYQLYQESIESKATEPFGDELAITEEISFESNGFTIVGDLQFPVKGEIHPAIIMVHGSGNATRSGAVPCDPLIEIFLRNGYAVFSWAKPGSGASTGTIDGKYGLTQRATILADGIEVLAKHPFIDSARIGLWGISQAGWVIPKALELTEDVAFMIVVSGGGEDGIKQMAYQVGQRVICDGGSAEQATLIEKYWSQQAKTTQYAEYREATEALIEIPQIPTLFNLQIVEEEVWKPWPRDIDAFFDPMEIIEHTTIPMLVFFGELDKNIGPVQGAEAYQAALQVAGNQNYQIAIIPNTGHVLMPAKTGCIGEFGG